jgi:hypothetical protein
MVMVIVWGDEGVMEMTTSCRTTRTLLNRRVTPPLPRES